ncbi:hypothetical protein BKA81DRAFT_9344 [Phyllosticta paracitricarpa]
MHSNSYLYVCVCVHGYPFPSLHTYLGTYLHTYKKARSALLCYALLLITPFHLHYNPPAPTYYPPQLLPPHAPSSFQLSPLPCPHCSNPSTLCRRLVMTFVVQIAKYVHKYNNGSMLANP